MSRFVMTLLAALLVGLVQQSMGLLQYSPSECRAIMGGTNVTVLLVADPGDFSGTSEVSPGFEAGRVCLPTDCCNPTSTCQMPHRLALQFRRQPCRQLGRQLRVLQRVLRSPPGLRSAAAGNASMGGWADGPFEQCLAGGVLSEQPAREAPGNIQQERHRLRVEGHWFHPWDARHGCVHWHRAHFCCSLRRWPCL